MMVMVVMMVMVMMVMVVHHIVMDVWGDVAGRCDRWSDVEVHGGGGHIVMVDGGDVAPAAGHPIGRSL